MESFEASGAAKRRRLTCPAMPADGVKVKGERSVESEVGPQSPGKGQTKTETNDLWLELKRQTEDMENHIRRLAGCGNKESLMAEEPSFEKKEIADSVKVKNEASAQQEISFESPQIGRMDMDDLWDLPVSGADRSKAFDANRLPRLSSADGSHATQGLEVFESVGVQNEEATPRGEETKEAPVAMPAAEHPLLLAVEQKPAKLRRYRLAKQSGARGVRWCTQAFGWKVRFPKVDCKGNFISWTSRAFRVKKFMVSGGTEVEADAAALEAATAFRTELVEKGILSEPKLKDPEFTSEVLGVSWSKSRKKWEVQVSPNKSKRIHGGCFTEKAAAEAKALELREKHGLQLQVKPVPALANRYAGLPVFHPKVPYPGVAWHLQNQRWRATCRVGGACRHFGVRPKDHSEAELERSFKVAVAWRKKQEKEKQGKAVKPKAKPPKK